MNTMDRFLTTLLLSQEAEIFIKDSSYQGLPSIKISSFQLKKCGRNVDPAWKIFQLELQTYQSSKRVLEEHHIFILRAPAFKNEDISMINTQMGNIYLDLCKIFIARFYYFHSLRIIYKNPTTLKRVIEKGKSSIYIDLHLFILIYIDFH